MTNDATRVRETHVTPKLSYKKINQKVVKLGRSTNVTTTLGWPTGKVKNCAVHDVLCATFAKQSMDLSGLERINSPQVVTLNGDGNTNLDQS